MQRMVRGLPPDVRGKIATVFCDSQFTHSYKVELRSTATRADAASIGEALDLALVTGESRGHNGINVEGRFGFLCSNPFGSMASHNPKELAGLLRFLGKEPADEPPSEVGEAIKTVLKAHLGRRYCIGCLAREIGARAHDVKEA